QKLPSPHSSPETLLCEVALTSSRYWWSTAVFFNAEWPSIIWKVTSNLKGPTISAELPKKISAEELAFLQYTSGSTGDAKGVMVSHANLMANCLIPCAHIGSPSHLGRERARPQFGPESIGITWLPHYHDMGLVATYLTALVWNVTLVGFSPLDFIKDPLLWPQLMSRYRGTVTAAPHFAYQLTARRIEAAEATKGALDLDLSSMVMAMDAAEPVNVRMREAMLTTWKRYGLPAGAYGVGYGLAEHVVKVTSGGVEGPEGMLGTVADCGSPWKDICLKIVDPETKMEMPEGEEGEIWLDSPSKALGYWKDPQSTRETFHARLASDGHVELSSSRSFLRTGDRGFMREGRLFVCGRIKNMIIIAGQNFYPQDIEQTVAEASEHVRPGQVVACSNAALTEEEQLLLALEVKDPEVYPENLATTLRARIEAEHGLLLWGLVLLKPRSLPKTTSGKLRHQKVAELFQTSFGSALVEKHFWGADADRDVHPIDWTGTSDRAARARRIEEWIVQEMPADAPSDSVVTSSAGAARLHARLLVALSAPCPGKDTVFHASVTSSHLPLSAVFADRAALARAAERAKFPEGPACPAPRRRTRREMVSTMTVQGKHKVPLVILWTWKTLGLLAPLLILLMPMFLLSTALDRLHLLYGTPVHNALLRALGAEIGYGAKLNIFARASCQLLSAGAGCSVDESSVKCHCLLDGELILSPIHLPAHSSIGPRCVLEPGSTLTPGTLLRARSVVLLGGAEAEGEMKTKMCTEGENIADSGKNVENAANGEGLDWAKLIYALVIHPYIFVGFIYMIFYGLQEFVTHGFVALMLGATLALILAGTAALMVFILLKWVLVGRPFCSGRDESLAPAEMLVPECLLRLALLLLGANVSSDAFLTMPSWLTALKGGELVTVESQSFLGGPGDRGWRRKKGLEVTSVEAWQILLSKAAVREREEREKQIAVHDFFPPCG
ncbi:unnamed protein product, partial [Durusdinium trenchii]